MDKVRQYVSGMSEWAMDACIHDYDRYEKEASTGDTELRAHVESLQAICGASTHSFVLWVEPFIKEVYRRYAMEFMKTKIGRKAL